MPPSVNAWYIGNPLATVSESRYDAQMNWPSLIADLQARNLSLTQIAALCRCGQSTLSDLKNKDGREPAFSLGQELIRLHKSSDRDLSRALAATEAKAA